MLDDFRDEEPGKILHEARYGESAAFEEMPHSPYYGSADATPLFVVLLDEYERWTGDADLVRELEFEARLALRWIDRYGDILGNGYEAGRIAQGILDAARYFDGRLPEAFAGYDRQLTKYPVEYPTACSPQAWSAGATLLLLRTVLGLEPDGDQLRLDPAVPDQTGPIDLLGIPGRWGLTDAHTRT